MYTQEASAPSGGVATGVFWGLGVRGLVFRV